MATKQYIKELEEEKDSLNPKRYQHAIRLLEEEISKIRITQDEMHHAYRKASVPDKLLSCENGIYKEETVTLREKIIVPVNRYPGYNFIGRLLGPRGSILKTIQGFTNTKISILGKGSTKNKVKEEELVKSNDPKYAHLKEPLHILICAEAVKSLAHERLGMALSKINKFMVPDSESLKPENRHQYQEEIMKMSEKVVLPVKEYPKFNFVGKLLGPKGNTLKSIQSMTQTRISILGEGSMWDKEKEIKLIEGNDPKYRHLKEPLYVLIQVEGPKSEAHTRLGAALKEIKKCLEPDDEEKGKVLDPSFLNYRGHFGLQAPILRVGIPPPGSIILSAPLDLKGLGDGLIAKPPIKPYSLE